MIHIAKGVIALVKLLTEKCFTGSSIIHFQEEYEQMLHSINMCTCSSIYNHN